MGFLWGCSVQRTLFPEPPSLTQGADGRNQEGRREVDKEGRRGNFTSILNVPGFPSRPEKVCRTKKNRRRWPPREEGAGFEENIFPAKADQCVFVIRWIYMMANFCDPSNVRGLKSSRARVIYVFCSRMCFF